MPRWADRTPQPRLHKPSGQARVRVDGREIYLGPWGSAEARRRYAEFLKEWTEARSNTPTLKPTPPVTISVAVFRFWTWAEQRYRHPDGSPTREADNLRAALKPLRRLFGELPLAQLGPAKLYALQDHLVTAGLARKTINARVNKVRRFVRWCVGRELAPASLVAALEAVEPLREGQGVRESPGRSPVPWATVEATLPHLPPMLAALVRVLWSTGARPGEVVRLTTGAIDRSAKVWQARLVAHKTAHRNQDRILLLGPEAQAALGPWLLPDEPDEPIFSPRRVDRRQANRCGGKRPPGRVYGRSSLAQALRRACRRAGVEVWSLAQLRHSRATSLRERYGLDVASTVLGHSRPSTTTIYSRAALAHAIAAVGEVG